MKHTREKWTIKDRWNVMVGERVIANCGGYSGKAGSTEENEANAQRIVACVNGCEGINPEAVKDLYEALREMFLDLWLPDGTVKRSHKAIERGIRAMDKACGSDKWRTLKPEGELDRL